MRAADQVEEGGLAGAVGADDGVDLAALDDGADLVDGGQAAEALGQVRRSQAWRRPPLRRRSRATLASRPRPPRRRLPAARRAGAPCQAGADDAVRQEDHQQDQQRAEHDEAVLLQELQVLRQPGHARCAPSSGPSSVPMPPTSMNIVMSKVWSTPARSGPRKRTKPAYSAARHAGIEHRQHEGQQLGAHQVDAQRLGQLVAVADGHEACGPAASVTMRCITQSAERPGRTAPGSTARRGVSNASGADAGGRRDADDADGAVGQASHFSITRNMM